MNTKPQPRPVRSILYCSSRCRHYVPGAQRPGRGTCRLQHGTPVSVTGHCEPAKHDFAYKVLISAVDKMMICFPETIGEGKIDTGFDLPALIVNDVRDALKAAKEVTDE